MSHATHNSVRGESFLIGDMNHCNGGNMMENIDIIPMNDPCRVKGVIELLGRLFPSRRKDFNEQWYHWKYSTYLEGEKTIFIVAVNEEMKVIGTRGFIPFHFIDQRNCQYLGYQSVDSAIAKEYRGQGLFRKLNLRALEIAKERQGAFVFNFPNDNSLPGYLKMGWEQDTSLIRMVRLPLLNREDERKWHSFCSQPKFQIEKDDKYLTWRYMQHPTFNYKVTKLDERVSVIHRTGYIGKARVEWLIDFVPSSYAFFQQDFSAVRSFIMALGRRRIVATTVNPVFTTVEKWKALGFRPLMMGRGACFVLNKISDLDITPVNTEITPGYIDTF